MLIMSPRLIGVGGFTPSATGSAITYPNCGLYEMPCAPPISGFGWVMP